jgi:MinD-like ATPase involved in chromosome partitioning or flagellar assembly
MIHFDEIKDKIINIIRNLTRKKSNYYIIRDVFGRIGIYILGEDNIDKIRNDITRELGYEWINTVRSIRESDMIFRELSNTTEQISENLYYGERQLVKKTWKNKKKSNISINGKVITFYSYKGGLGRTTTLMLTALQLVRKGKKVVIVDFDLEAPGVATLLKPENNQYYPKYGTIDFLLESTNYSSSVSQIDIDEYIYSITSKKLTGLSGGELFVMQATNTNDMKCDEYFQKISRVDFATPQYTKSKNPVELLLNSIDKRYSPDYILIDSRAGIHDIGGITLTKYTDEVVCIFYVNDQNIFGMNFVLPIIVEENIPFYLINSPVPLSEEEAEEERNIYLQSSMEILCKCGYYKNNIPDVLDESAEHFPLDIKYNIEATIINSENRIQVLLENEGTNNIYYKLAEKLDSESKVAIESDDTLLDRKKILEEVECITPGETPSSENEFNSVEDLRKGFYPLKDYKYIFDNNKFLVIGPKGSGKTALYSVLKYPEYARALAKYVDVSSRDIDKTEWIVGLGIGKEFPLSDNFEVIAETKDIRFYRKYWQCLIVKVLKKYIKEYIKDIPEVITNIIESRYSLFSDIINNNRNLSEIILDILHNLDQKLEENDKLIIITYDYLDVTLTKKYRGDMIAALISLWFENIPRLDRIKAKIFLREDIFKFEVKDGVTDKAKLNNYTANIGWTYEYLLAMVWKRIVENSRNLAGVFERSLSKEGYSLPKYDEYIGFVPLPNSITNKIILKKLIGEKMGKGNKAYTYNWIFYRLADTNDKIKPRSILKLFSMAAKNELADIPKNDGTNYSIIRPKSLENSIQQVSEDTLRDLSEEYSEYENIFNSLKNHYSQFPIDEENLKDALIKCGIDENNVITVIYQLKEIGVLKEYQRRKSDPIRYHIPDIYLKGMGLSRKGYR